MGLLRVTVAFPNKNQRMQKCCQPETTVSIPNHFEQLKAILRPLPSPIHAHQKKGPCKPLGIGAEHILLLSLMTEKEESIGELPLLHQQASKLCVFPPSGPAPGVIFYASAQQKLLQLARSPAAERATTWEAG